MHSGHDLAHTNIVSPPSVNIRIADSQAKIGDGVARSYIVTVDRAWGLAKADRFGKADPFISIKVTCCFFSEYVVCHLRKLQKYCTGLQVT